MFPFNNTTSVQDPPAILTKKRLPVAAKKFIIDNYCWTDLKKKL